MLTALYLYFVGNDVSNTSSSLRTPQEQMMAMCDRHTHTHTHIPHPWWLAAESESIYWLHIAHVTPEDETLLFVILRF